MQRFPLEARMLRVASEADGTADSERLADKVMIYGNDEYINHA
jgi:hypothetical protein